MRREDKEVKKTEQTIEFYFPLFGDIPHNRKINDQFYSWDIKWCEGALALLMFDTCMEWKKV